MATRKKAAPRRKSSPTTLRKTASRKTAATKRTAKKRTAKKTSARPTARKKSTRKAATRTKASGKNAGGKKTAAKKTTRKKATPARKFSRAASENVHEELHEMEHGKLRSGRSGKKVTSRKQAIAIGLSEARRSGKKVPPDPNR
jgi:hypothetical protein